MTNALIIVWREGLWHVVREDRRTVSLFSSESATVAAQWRDAHEGRRAA